MGGLGLRAAEDHAPAAFAASFLASRTLAGDLLNLAEGASLYSLPPLVLESLREKTGEVLLTEETADVGQKASGNKIDLRNATQLEEATKGDGMVREVARLASLGLPQAGAWLLTTPIAALGNHLRGPEFVLAVKYRLGLPVYDRAGPCPSCLRPSDRFGDHSLCCGYGGERITRHNQLRDALYDTAASAALGPVKEGRFLLPGSDRRPADVYIPSCSGGLDCALDVTVINPLQKETIAGAAEVPGHALRVAYRRKVLGAEAACRQQGIAFVPIALESFGGVHEVAVAEVRKLAAALARHTGQEEAEACRHLFSRLAILLQRGNAAILANRIPTFPNAETDGDRD